MMAVIAALQMSTQTIATCARATRIKLDEHSTIYVLFCV